MKVSSWYLAVILIVLPTISAWGYSADDCIGCHREGSEKSRLHISVDEHLSSIHGAQIKCIDCHSGVNDDTHIKLRASGKVDCRQCHEQKNLHGQVEKVKCYNCHTRHYIYDTDDPRSSVFQNNLRITCGKCHPNESKGRGGLSFLPSLQIVSHPKQDFAKIYDDGMCVGCHQGQAAHGEDFPIRDQDCYKCHVPLGQKKGVLGYIHVRADWHEQPVNFFAGYISLICLTGLVLIFFVGIMTVRGNRKQ